MRTSAPFLLSLRSFRVWRVGVFALLLLAVASMSAWTWTVRAVLGPWDAAALVFSLVAIATLGAWLWTVPARPAELRWDGTCWHLLELAKGGALPVLGSIAVAIDMGAWMLLSFRAADSARHRRRWLPAERRNAPAQWHALRCAVYSARPAAASGARAPVSGS
jgi:hypothetical protein